MNRGIVFVISAPSGTGKSTLIERLTAEVSGLGFSISHTSRPARRGERDGVDYHFVDPARFEKMIREGRFAEWADVHGNYYGTSMASLEEVTARGEDALLDIDVQGAFQIAEKMDEAVLIFLLPPSWELLEERLRGRGSDEDSVVVRRLENGSREVAKAARYDYLLVNDDLGEAAESLASIVKAERAKRDGQTVLKRLVEETGRKV